MRELNITRTPHDPQTDRDQKGNLFFGDTLSVSMDDRVRGCLLGLLYDGETLKVHCDDFERTVCTAVEDDTQAPGTSGGTADEHYS